MPFPFVLSTTSHLSFQQNFISSTHPSLPSAATSHRNLLRATLKQHKRLPPSDQASNLNGVLTGLTSYLKYLCTLDLALSGAAVNDQEDVDLALVREVEVEWRPTLSSAPIPGRDSERIKGQGLDYEFYFVHHNYAVVQNLLARQALLGLYASTIPTTQQRLALIQTASRHLKTAYSVHTFLLQRFNSGDGPPELPASATDVSFNVQTALQRLSQAEFSLYMAFKDDPYPAILVQARNELDREWMIRAPEIPQTRAQVLTRLCVAAAEHAASASAALRAEGKRVSKDLLDYTDDLRRTSRARACRFQAIDADAHNETGKAIAWIHAGLNELGAEITTAKDGTSSKSSSGLSKLKASWNERREDRRIEKGSARWGADAGKAEELRILEYLQRKFVKSNDTVHFQRVPDYRPLVGMLPSSINMPMGDEKWKVPVLGEDELVVMRAPPDGDEMDRDSSGEEDGFEVGAKRPVGAFPGTDGDGRGSYY